MWISSKEKSYLENSNQSILEEISPEYSLEGLMLKLKLLVLWPPEAKNWLIGKDPDAGEDWRQEEKGMTEDEMVGWHHWLDGHEFEQAPGVGDGQGSLVCCSPWDLKESDTTEQLNWTMWDYSITEGGRLEMLLAKLFLQCLLFFTWKIWPHQILLVKRSP